MSASTQVRSSKLFGRTVMVAAAAGIVGVAMTLIVAIMLLVGEAQAPAQVTVQQQWPLEPGYLDYGQRHPVTVQQPEPLEPGYLDYGQRHPKPVPNADD